MFIGHHAAAFAAKRFAPRVSLGTLFGATMLLDLVWPLLLILGVEHVRIDPGNTAFTPLDFYDYPYTHSLLNVLGWSILAALGYAVFRKKSGGTGSQPVAFQSMVVGGAVLSHWVLDFVTHRPDLPLWPGGPLVGLGLWNSVTGTIVVEVALFLLCLWMYLRTTTAIDRIGSIALWALVLFAGAIYVVNIKSPPPPNERVLGYAALAGWLFVPWGYWIDRHRRPRT